MCSTTSTVWSRDFSLCEFCNRKSQWLGSEALSPLAFSGKRAQSCLPCMGHSYWAWSRRFTRSKARLECAKMTSAYRDFLSSVPYPRFRSRLRWRPQFVGIPCEWSILAVHVEICKNTKATQKVVRFTVILFCIRAEVCLFSVTPQPHPTLFGRLV